MLSPYQTRYVENAREIAALSDFYSVSTSDFESWCARQRQAKERIGQLKKENVDLLNRFLFSALDDLHSAGEGEIQALEEFADQLMDWSTNLDCGVYVLIHDSLLHLYRIRKDRNRIIKELYKLGMGLYYQNSMIHGIFHEQTRHFQFQNEMVFTEAGSYLRFFENIEDEETKGYIIRSLANIAICTADVKRRIAVSARILKIVQDDYYRALAPGLPWETFLRRTNQQMSSNRTVLSRGNLTTEELAAVLESCHDVFKPETLTQNPNVRWMWPYYEMEYTCGFVDLETTMDRLERLIDQTPWDQYDVSGVYGNIQLPIYYGRLVESNPQLQSKPRHVRFLTAAYRKMLRTIFSFPTEKFDDYFFHGLSLVLTGYYETEGVETYRDVSSRLMQRVSGRLYIRSRKAGDILRLYCAAIFESDPAFFDDIDFLRAIEDPARKKAVLLDYAADCGLYHDFGLIKMHVERLQQTRNLFETEYQMMKLHTVSGQRDLAKRESTRIFADVALGHHAWYNGAGGYPEDYVRTQSQYRQMTDVVAVTAYLVDHFRGDLADTVNRVLALAGKRFSPLVTPFLMDTELQKKIGDILCGDETPYYRLFYDQLTSKPEEAP